MRQALIFALAFASLTIGYVDDASAANINRSASERLNLADASVNGDSKGASLPTRANDPTLGSGVLGEPGNPPGTSTAARFERLDTDHDGSISRAEARQDAALSKKFSAADKDKDGKLSDAEFRNIDQP